MWTLRVTAARAGDQGLRRSAMGTAPRARLTWVWRLSAARAPPTMIHEMGGACGGATEVAKEVERRRSARRRPRPHAICGARRREGG